MYIIHQAAGGLPLHYRIGQIAIEGEGEEEHLKVALHTNSADPVLTPTGETQVMRFDQEAIVPKSALQDPDGVVVGVAKMLVAENGPLPGGVMASDEHYPFEARKFSMRTQVKAKRNALRSAVAPTPAGPVDIDGESRDMITGAVLMAMLNKQLGNDDWELDFTLANDQDVTLNADEVLGLGMAVGAYVNAAQRRKRELDAAINASVSLADLEAIDVETGWPA
jgi:hypothetical protein